MLSSARSAASSKSLAESASAASSCSSSSRSRSCPLLMTPPPTLVATYSFRL
ncbi:hypothetical protein ACFPRL_13250 [Pseudoclavibacter helvolus]